MTSNDSLRDRIIRRLQRVRLTRESLIRMAVGIFAGFILLSVVISLFRDPSKSVRSEAFSIAFEEGSYEAEKLLVEYLREHPDAREEWIALCQLRAGSYLTMRKYLEEAIDDLEKMGQLVRPGLRDPKNDTPFLPDLEFERFLRTSPVPIEILHAWRDSNDLQAALAHLFPLERSFEAQLEGAKIALADGSPEKALPYFENARALDPENPEAIDGWIHTLGKLGRDAEVDAALEDPIVRRGVDPRLVFEHFRARKEYLRAYWPLILSEYQRWPLGLWLACLAIGGCWILFCFHLGTGWQWRKTIQWLVPVALVLGWLSADATLGAVVFFSDWLGNEAGRDVQWHVVHALMIGLREEVIKLLLFVPLLPYLIRAASDIQALALASIVGLGFAVNENANYIISSGGHGILGRFLTANFLHMALTGYAGYYLFRALRQRSKADWLGAVEALAKVIVIHGAYDFFLIAPQLSDWTILSMILFILISQQYLRLFFHVRHHRVQRVSSTRIFVAALATATGIHYLYLSTYEGIGAALWHTFGGLLGIAVITFMYFQEFDEHVA